MKGGFLLFVWCGFVVFMWLKVVVYELVSIMGVWVKLWCVLSVGLNVVVV